MINLVQLYFLIFPKESYHIKSFRGSIIIQLFKVLKQVQDYAGHSDFLTTFNVYSHTDDSDKKTEMDYITSCFTNLFGNNGEG